MKINIITLGCSKNIVDSENLAGQYKAQGHTVYFDRAKNDCDLVVVNTCGFIGDAKEESVNVILEQIAAKKRRRNKTRLVVCGCLVQRYRDELRAEMPEVDEWRGTDLIGFFGYFQYALSEGLYVSRWEHWSQRYFQHNWIHDFGLHFTGVSVITLLILIAVVSIGIYIPARSISRVNPVDALKDE